MYYRNTDVIPKVNDIVRYVEKKDGRYLEIAKYIVIDVDLEYEHRENIVGILYDFHKKEIAINQNNIDAVYDKNPPSYYKTLKPTLYRTVNLPPCYFELLYHHNAEQINLGFNNPSHIYRILNKEMI